MLADGRIWHAAGASEVQELAAVLSPVIAYLRLFEAHGLSSERAATRIGVALAADTDQFLTIAKLRAMRLLLARALEAADIAAILPLHAETAWRTMSRREPRMNVLRATGAAFAAAVGGANSITVLPFDALDGSPTAEALRLARNTQLVIAEEAASRPLRRSCRRVGRGGDTDRGTGREGLGALPGHRVRRRHACGARRRQRAGDIAATREKRLAAVADRAVEMVGVNAFVARNGEPSSARRRAAGARRGRSSSRGWPRAQRRRPQHDAAARLHEDRLATARRQRAFRG